MTLTKRFLLGSCCLLLVGLAGCGEDGPPADLPVSEIQFALQPIATPQGTAFNVTVIFLNALGHLVQVEGQTVTLSLDTNPGGGTLAGVKTATTKLGVAYFFGTLSIDALGNGYSLRAVSGDLSAVSDLFDIIEPTQIAFTLAPSGAVVGQPFGVKIEARDDNSKRVPIDGLVVTVALEDNPAGGTLLGTPMSTTRNGIALIPNLALDTVGTGYTLRATAGSLTIVSSPFEITAAPTGGGPGLPPIKVVFTNVPTSVTAGVPFTVDVEVRDANENPVVSAVNPVTISIVQDGGSRLMHASGWPGGGQTTVLEYIDRSNASTVTSLGTTSDEINCLGFDPTAGLAYGGGWAGNCYSYNPASGAESFLGSPGPTHGMTYDAANNRMLAVSKNDNNLYVFDPLFGTLTSLGGVGGVTGFNGLSMHPTTGTLYAIDDSRALVTIDVNTLTSTLIGNVDGSTASISFHPDGTLYAMIGSGFDALPGETLYTVDLNTAAFTVVGFAGAGQDGEAIGFVGSSLVGTQTMNPTLGVVSFTDLQLDTPGTGFQLGATSPGLVPDTSATFDVNP